MSHGTRDLSFPTGIEPTPPVLEAQSLNYCSAREVPLIFLECILCFSHSSKHVNSFTLPTDHQDQGYTVLSHLFKFTEMEASELGFELDLGFSR